MLMKSFLSPDARHYYRRVGIVSSDGLISWQKLRRYSNGDMIPVLGAYMPQSYSRAQVMAKFKAMVGSSV